MQDRRFHFVNLNSIPRFLADVSGNDKNTGINYN